MEQQIEQMARECEPCQALKNKPAPTTLHPWTWPERPWQRLHIDFAIDFAGPFLGKSFLIIVDAHSKWPKVIPEVIPCRLLGTQHYCLCSNGRDSPPPACHPLPPPHPTSFPPTHPLISAIHDITGPVKSYLKNQQ